MYESSSVDPSDPFTILEVDNIFSSKSTVLGPSGLRPPVETVEVTVYVTKL